MVFVTYKSNSSDFSKNVLLGINFWQVDVTAWHGFSAGKQLPDGLSAYKIQMLPQIYFINAKNKVWVERWWPATLLPVALNLHSPRRFA